MPDPVWLAFPSPSVDSAISAMPGPANGTGHPDHALIELYDAVRMAERDWLDAQDRADQAFGSRAYLAAQRDVERAEAHQEEVLLRFLNTPAQSPLGVALKLRLACELEGYADEAASSPAGTEGCHAIVAALADAERLAGMADDPDRRGWMS